jgi:hypothetical protein
MVATEVRSINENTCWEGIDLILRYTVDVWTYKEHKERKISEIEMS